MLCRGHGPLPEQAVHQVLESCISDSAPPESAVKPENAVLDRQALGRIRALHRPGGPNLLAKVLGLYSSSSLALTDAIRGAAQSSDAESVRQAAHALKSSSANVGAMAFPDLCKEVEVAAAQGRLEQAKALADGRVREPIQV